MLSRVICYFLAAACAAGSPTILVTGATGGTGLLVYNLLKEKGINTRAFVRNVTKARSVLKCNKCDASEGIFVGDVTQEASMTEAMSGVTGLAVVTSSMPHCTDFRDPKTCSYPKHAYPVDVDFDGGKAQIAAYAKGRDESSTGSVVLCSSMGTTEPDNFLDQLGNGHIGFFKLNEEAALMSSGIPFTIVKPCGLTNDPAGQRELIVGHDDEINVKPPAIPRGDVARVMVEALLNPQDTSGLRFDLCSQVGHPTTDLGEVFQKAKYPWQKTLTFVA